MKSILTRFLLGAVVMFVTIALSSAAAYSQQADEDPSPNNVHPHERPNTTQPQQSGNAEQLSTEPHTQEALAFTGIVTRDRNSNDVTLNDPVTKLVYKFDDPAKADHYLGKKVKVVGKLGMNSNTIQVDSIEAIPDDGKR